MYRTIYYVIVAGISLFFTLSFWLDIFVLRFIMGGFILLSWVLPLTLKKMYEEYGEDEEEDAEEDESSGQVSSAIPGYEKSGIDIKGCYNCRYSKDIENETFVYCKKYQQKVYRHNVCDMYKV